MHIDIDPDRVTINGQVIISPARILPSQWISYWEWIKKNGPRL